MTTKDFVKDIATKCDMTQVKASEVFDTILAGIVAEVKASGDFNMKGIGRISTKEVPATVARNPKTGAEVKVPAKKKVMFKASSTLKASVNE